MLGGEIVFGGNCFGFVDVVFVVFFVCVCVCVC